MRYKEALSIIEAGKPTLLEKEELEPLGTPPVRLGLSLLARCCGLNAIWRQPGDYHSENKARR